MPTKLKTTKTIKAGLSYRCAELDRSALSESDRTLEISFSSEAAIQTSNRQIGSFVEILDHRAQSVDMTRLHSGANLLVEHDRADVVGVVEEASIGPDKRGRALVRFGKGVRASEIFQDVVDGIRRLVSVGYRVHEWVTEKIEDGGMKTLRAIRWEPVEVSIVSVPADVSVGVGRSERRDEEHEAKLIEETPTMKIRSLLDANPPDREGGGNPPSERRASPETPNADVNLAATATQKRSEEVRDMLAVARAHKVPDEMFDKAIERGIDSHKFRAEVLDFIKGKPQNEITSRETGRQSNLTLGERFIASEEFRSQAKRAGKSKNISMEVDGLSIRATLLTTTGLTSYERPPGIVLLEQQPLTVAQLLAQGETSAATVRYVREVSFTNAATSVAEEGLKPEASFDLEEVDAAVKKIAVLGRTSDEILEDFPQVRDYVNNRLVYMVGAEEEDQLLNGAGAGSDITGILATSGIQTQAATGIVVDGIFRAMNKVQTIGFFTPDAIVINSTDWMNVRLTKDQNGQYYGGGPFNGAYNVGGYSIAGTLWGLPVVATTRIAQGTALVGAFKLGGQIFRRNGIRVEMTNSDADDFKYNRICIRAEERLALAVYRPLAFSTVTGIPLA